MDSKCEKGNPPSDLLAVIAPNRRDQHCTLWFVLLLWLILAAFDF